jgi:MFS family permease
VLRPYVRVFRAPGLAVPLVMCFLGALAINMQALSVLLLVRAYTGSFAQAGAVTAALSLGASAGLVLQGSLLDRYGQARVLVPAGALCGCVLVLLALTATAGSPLAVVSALAVLAGAGTPAVPSAMRVLCPQLLPGAQLRTSAYALLAMQFQAVAVLGPLLVSGLLLVLRPDAVVLLTAVVTATAAVGFAATGASRRWRAAGARGWRPRSAATPGMRTLLLSGFGAGAVTGMVVVGIPAVAVGNGAAPLAGVLLAAAAVGSIAGGFVYGSRPWRRSLPDQLVLAQTGEAAAALGLWIGALLLVPVHPVALAPVALVSGLATAPVVIISSTLVDVVAEPGILTGSYTTLIAAILLGMAAGNYAAGNLTELAGGPSTFAAAAAVLSAVALWTFARRRTLVATPARDR